MGKLDPRFYEEASEAFSGGTVEKVKQPRTSFFAEHQGLVAAASVVLTAAVVWGSILLLRPDGGLLHPAGQGTGTSDASREEDTKEGRYVWTIPEETEDDNAETIDFSLVPAVVEADGWKFINGDLGPGYPRLPVEYCYLMMSDPDRILPEEVILPSKDPNGRTVTAVMLTKKNLSNVKRLALPRGLLELKDEQFKNYTSLEFVIFGKSLQSIGKSCFEGCRKLVQVDLPDSVTKIGTRAFAGCTSMKYMTIGKGLTVIPEAMCENCGSLRSLEAGPIAVIEADAFGSCGKLETVTLAGAPCGIGDRAFRFCKSLTSFAFPDVPTVCPDNNQCNGKIGAGAFRDNAKLISFTVPKGIKSIMPDAFRDCSSLILCTLPDGLEAIYSNAFTGCPQLTDVVLPESLMLLDLFAFPCDPKSAIPEAEQLDKGAALTETAIAYTAYGNCLYLGSAANPYYALVCVDDRSQPFVKIHQDTQIIGVRAFEYYTKLVQVSLPAVKSIGNYAFVECTSLSRVTLAEGLKSIEDAAFYSCTSLGELILPASVTHIGSGIIKNCPLLEQHTYDGGIYLGTAQNPYAYFVGMTSETITKLSGTLRVHPDTVRMADKAIFWQHAKAVFLPGTLLDFDPYRCITRNNYAHGLVLQSDAPSLPETWTASKANPYRYEWGCKP